MNQYLDIVRAAAAAMAEQTVTVLSDDGVRPPDDQRASDPELGRIQIGDERAAYFLWQGGQFIGDLVALDTETTLIQSHKIPELALATASNGTTHCVIHPDRLGEFIMAHRHQHVVGHNVAFDFWVVDQHLRRSGESEALEVWWNIPDQARMHDTMWLEALIRLARSDEFPQPHDLGQVAHRYTGLEIDKNDPYRLRYAEIIGQDWDTVDARFFDYATKDAIATYRTYIAMVSIAKSIMGKYKGDLLDCAAERFGWLTDAVQVQAAIALAAMSRHGLHLDGGQVQQTQTQLRDEMARRVAQLSQLPEADGLFKTDRAGNYTLAPKSRAPCVNKKKLAAVLELIVSDADEEIEVPLTEKTKTPTTSAKFWAQHEHLHPFISRWVSLTNLAKLSQFFVSFQDGIIHPRYSVLVRTGRTSCSDPNIQQLPRSAGFREMVIASPGHLLLAIDYSAIELRTLAAICEHRFGCSLLADVLRAGTDPHAYTAALFGGMTLDQFIATKDTDPEQFGKLRQQAKALNFGIPGGLGAASLVSYAAGTYGVTLTIEEASAFRQKLIEAVYPELSLYLQEDPIAVLADNLNVDTHLCRNCFQSSRAIRNVVRGQQHKTNGAPYDQDWYDGVWDKLISLNRNPDLQPALSSREGSEDLLRQLFWSPVATPTGRVRGHVGFSQARNTPFQGLAADGAKRAIFQLTKAGYRCVGFIHDEVLIELPDEVDHAAEAGRIDRIMCDSMQEVTGAVPVNCEYTLSYCWSKDAERIVDDDGRLLPWGDRPRKPHFP